MISFITKYEKDFSMWHVWKCCL